jgi:hypothetical protein
MAFDFGLAAVIGGTLLGGAIVSKGARDQAAALEAQAGLTAGQADRLAAFQLEMAETEAALTVDQAADEAEIAEFNAAIARDNAEFEARAGAFAEEQAVKRWESHLGTVRAGLAASGFRVDGTATAVIAEQAAEMALEARNIRDTAARNVRARENQARLFELRKGQVADIAGRESAAIRRAGEIEAESIRLIGQTQAQAARIRASGARTDSLTSLIGAGVQAATFARMF